MMLRRLRDRVLALVPAEVQLDRARTFSRAGRMDEALAIWRPLAEAGIARAQTNLGACYATGTGLPVDLDAARQWLHRGALGGDPLGQRNLASLLLPHDPAAALDWYRRAAEAGDAESQDQLSHMLLTAVGTTADPAEARRWAEAAATQDIKAAAARLGTMCHDAIGGPRDPLEAVRWWRAAAEAGDSDSAARLGAALHLGQGIREDQVAAMAWLLVASGRHSILVRPFFTRVRDSLTAAQLVQAQDMARGLGWNGPADQRPAPQQLSPVSRVHDPHAA